MHFRAAGRPPATPLTVQIKPGRPTKLAQVTITVTGTEALVYFAQAMLRPKLRRTGTAGHPLRPSGQPAGSRGSVGAARPAGRDGVNGYVGRDGSDGARGSQGWPRGSVGAYLRRTRGRDHSPTPREADSPTPRDLSPDSPRPSGHPLVQPAGMAAGSPDGPRRAAKSRKTASGAAGRDGTDGAAGRRRGSAAVDAVEPLDRVGRLAQLLALTQSPAQLLADGDLPLSAMALPLSAGDGLDGSAGRDDIDGAGDGREAPSPSSSIHSNLLPPDSPLSEAMIEAMIEAMPDTPPYVPPPSSQPAPAGHAGDGGDAACESPNPFARRRWGLRD